MKKCSSRQVISLILVKRTDEQILGVIEYRLPETNIPPIDNGGDVSYKVTGPEEIGTGGA